MRIMIRAALAVLLLVGPAVGTALAVTSSQLVDLMKAGLGDDVLIALIQTDGSTFQLTTADILALHKQGLSDKVILAMQATSRKTPPKVADREQPIQSCAEPQIAEPVVREQIIPVTPPQVVNVYQTVSQRVEPAQPLSTQVVPLPIAVPIFVRPVPIKQEAPPVYWGWNGQRRPDTWQPTPPQDPPSAKTATPAKKGGS